MAEKYRYKQPQCVLPLAIQGAGESLGAGGGRRPGYCIPDDGKELCPSKAMEWQSLKSSGELCGLVGKVRHILRQMECTGSLWDWARNC